MFQHLAKLLTQISPRSPPYFNSPFLRHWSDGRCYSRIAPHQNYPPRTVPLWIPQRLDRTRDKKGISLTSPCHPKAALQPLPSMLRMYHVRPIRSCSKAPGVFSSNYRYPASSPEVHFHRASPRDSSPVITPFVHVGIYPTRNCAIRSFQRSTLSSPCVALRETGARRLVSEGSRALRSTRVFPADCDYESLPSI